MTDACYMRESSLWASLKIQIRVIRALVIREMLTRYGRNNIGFLWLFLEPMLFVLAVTLIWNVVKDVQNFKLPVTAFAITGYCPVLLWRNMVSRCSGAIGPNIGLFYHRNVKVLDVFLARIILEFMGATISFIGLILLFTSIGMMEAPLELMSIVSGWFLLAWFGASLALLLGCLSEKYELVDRIWAPLSYMLIPFAGAAFMVDWLRSDHQELMLKLPMVHGVELLRKGYFGAAVRPHYDVGYVVVICIVLTFSGLLLMRRVAREMSPS